MVIIAIVIGIVAYLSTLSAADSAVAAEAEKAKGGEAYKLLAADYEKLAKETRDVQAAAGRPRGQAYGGGVDREDDARGGVGASRCVGGANRGRARGTRWCVGDSVVERRRSGYFVPSTGRSRTFSIPVTRQWSSTRFILSRTSNTLPE